MMNSVKVCILEDVRFKADWDIPSVLGFNKQRMRAERGWTFHLDKGFCPESDLHNADAHLISSEAAYTEAQCFLANGLTGYGCVFCDCKLKANGNPIPLAEPQIQELRNAGIGDIAPLAYPGLYLALCAAQNRNWHGVIAIASSASSDDWRPFVNSLQAIAGKKRIVSCKSLANTENEHELRTQFDSAIFAFLDAVGARNPPKQRLHPRECESWFEDDHHAHLGHPPHTWRAFEQLDANSPARKARDRYLANLFGCTEADAADWATRAHQGILHSQLKMSLGACAKVHAAKHTIRGPTLFTVLLAASAWCPNPFAWVKYVNVPPASDVFHHDCSPEVAKSLFNELVGNSGLFQRLFVWDLENCPHRAKDEPVIIAVQMSCDLLKIKLHNDFSVSRLASRNGQTKQSLDKMNEALRKGSHPLLITLDEAENAVVFETKGTP